jgi:hypothetical protein
MTRLLLALALLALGGGLLAGTAPRVHADHEPAAEAGITLHWPAPTTLVIEAGGFRPDEPVLLDVLVTHDALQHTLQARGLGQLLQLEAGRLQLTTSVAADAAGMVQHRLALSVPADTPVQVTLTDQAGHPRTATTAVPAP